MIVFLIIVPLSITPNARVHGNTSVSKAVRPSSAASSLAVSANDSQIESLDILNSLNVGGAANFACTLNAQDVTINNNLVGKNQAKVKKLKAQKIQSTEIETDHLHVFGDEEICGDLYVDGFISASSLDLLGGGGDMTLGDITVDSINVLNNATIDGSVSSCDVIVGCNLFLNDTISPAVGNVIKNGNRFITTAPGSTAQSTFIGENSGNFGAANTATQNTALGNSALSSIAEGRRNTGIGALALQNNPGNGSGDGWDNTAVGAVSLNQNIIGSANTAIGSASLLNNTNGNNNTALGYTSLLSNQLGVNNTAVGSEALRDVQNGAFGSYNTAVGSRALSVGTNLDSNTALGYFAGIVLNGTHNIVIGTFAGGNNTLGNNNIYIDNLGVNLESNTIRMGTGQTATFIAGINGTAIGTSVPVLVNAAGQLGTTVSSRRFKNHIQDIGSASDLLMQLRPVMFKYNSDDTSEINYGFIAEEVAHIYPELVIYDQDGQPYSVKYHLLYALLLNEIQKNRAHLDLQQQDLQALDAKYANQIQQLIERIMALEARN